jgi:nitrite reductase/ring-hydroxylating ferredoxin subunit
MYAASLWARKRGRRGLGAVLGLAGAGATMVGGYLGGHLVMSQGVGVDHTAFEHPPSDWQVAMPERDLAEGAPHMVDLDGTRVVLVRQGERIFALADTCSHAGGPLHEGDLEDGCIRCPWHASVFRLADGSVVHGPARAPVTAFDVRTEDGDIQVRAAPE